MTEHTDAYLRDYREVLAGRKPAIIVEQRKSHKAWAIIRAATANGMRGPSANVMLDDSAGVAHPAIIVGRTWASRYR